MDSSDVVINDTPNPRIAQWLADWRHWLDLWLECGTDSPGPQAVETTTRWQRTIPTDGFDQVRHRTKQLLATDSTRASKADALLSLIVWQRATERMLETSE